MRMHSNDSGGRCSHGRHSVSAATLLFGACSALMTVAVPSSLTRVPAACPFRCACRDQFLPELLDVAYGLLRMRYLSHAWQLLQGAASWQAAEAALYLLTAVSLSVKTCVLSDAGAAAGGDENCNGSGAGAGAASAAAAEDRQQTQQLLAALFRQVCSPEGGASMLGAHPALAEATCRLVEHYSSWFGKAAAGEDDVPLQSAFQLLLRALPIPQVGAHGCLCLHSSAIPGSADQKCLPLE